MKQIIAIDTETYLFKPYQMAPRIVCLSEYEEKGRLFVNQNKNIETRLYTYFTHVLAGEFILVGHSVAYDMACICSNFPEAIPLVFKAYQNDGIVCTAIREKLLDIAVGEFKSHNEDDNRKKHGYSLAEIAGRKLNVQVPKKDTWRLKYEELDGLPESMWPKEAVDYAINDAFICREIFLDQERRAKALDYALPTQFEDSRADFALKLMSVWGITVDESRVEKLWDETVSRMDELAESLKKDGLVRGKKKKQSNLFRQELPKVTKSLETIRLHVDKCLKYPPKTEKGNIATDKETLQQCSWPPFDDLIEYSELQKLASTYISKLFQPIIHADFFGIGAESGRTSCARPNLQNQKRVPGIRECFVPREGYCFLACDFDSQEMRTLAQSCLDLCGYSRLAERYQKDPHFDPHLEFAKVLCPEEPKKMRQEAKVANFGFPGGMFPKSFVDYARSWGLNLTQEQATNIREAWLTQWPEMRDYFRHVDVLVGSAGYGQQIIPKSGFMRGAIGFRDGSNGYFQTLANHASKRALWEVVTLCYTGRDSWLYGSRPVLFIHDEVILETPLRVASEAALEMERVMVKAMRKWTPDVPCAASATLMDCWSKKAKRVFDEQGKLKVWRYERTN